MRTLPAAAAFAALALLMPDDARAADVPDLCAPAQYAELAADAQAVCDHGKVWIDRFKAGDIDGLMALYEPDAQVALHDQRKLTGVAQIREFFAPSLAARPDVVFELHVEDIRIHGETAMLVSRYWYTSTARRGEKYQDAGRSALIYKRVPGKSGHAQWRILLDIDNNTPDVAFPKP